MRIIKSLQNEQIKSFAKLKEKKYRDETGLFLVEGEHLVRMAIEANSLKIGRASCRERVSSPV